MTRTRTRTRARARAWTLAWLLALACACRQSDDLTQTVVWLDAEPAARAALTHVTVQAVGPMDNREPSEEAQDPTWPIKLVFAPKYGDASRRFTLRIEAHGKDEDADDGHVVKLSFETGFVANQSRFALLMIRDACLSRSPASCSGDAACDAWELAADARKLGLSAQTPLQIEASCDPEQPPSTDSDGAAGSTAKPDPTRASGSGANADAGTQPSDTDAADPPGGAASPTDDPMSTTDPGGSCEMGLARQGGECVDIDECQNGAPCGEHGACENTEGSYTCLCEPGFDGSTGTCLDLDECQQADLHGCEDACVNSVGGYACECGEGWIKADRKACGQFSEAQRLELGGSVEPTLPRFAFDGEGNGVAVWTQSDGTKSLLWSRRYSATEGWAPTPTPLEISGEGNPSGPALALDAGGRGALVWLQATEERSDIWAARYASGRFGTPAKISRDDAGTAYPGVTVDLDDGDGFAVWSQSDGSHVRVWANRLSSLGWAGARTIGTDSSDEALAARLAMGPGGHASLVWTEVAFTESAISRATAWIMRFDPSSLRWGSAVRLDDGDFAGMPDTDLYDPDGTGLSVWVRVTDQRASVLARSDRFGAGPGGSTDIAESSSQLTWVAPRIALSPTGSGAAIWTQGQASEIQVWANRFEGETGSWATAARLSDVDSSGAPFPMIAVDPSGDGIAVWSDIVGTGRVVRARRLQAGVGWLQGVALGEDVISEATPSSPVHVAVDARGNAIAIWDVLEGGRYHVRASRFE